MYLLRRKITRRKLWLLFFIPDGLFLFLLLLNYLFPLPAEKSFSRVILARDSSLLSAYLTPDDKWRMETKLKDVSPELLKAIVNKEDKYFFSHPGINPAAILRAAFSNIVHFRRVSGASTISMQLARLMLPGRRTYSNKFAEMLRALQLEWNYPKDRILELYMSYVPFGGNIEGIKAASFIYFHRPAAKLSMAQSVLLTIVPNRPNSLRLDKFTREAIRGRDKWLRRFQEEKLFKEQLIQEALQEPVQAKRHELIPQAPHYSLFIKNTYPQNEVLTTLDISQQRKAEKLLKTYTEGTRIRGVTNGTVIVIDNKTQEVKAYCGSADFNDNENAGQVNGVRAYRSPGSTLKPFLYALSMDKGLITPKSLLMDIPTNINGYTPENYDNQYRGEVTAEFALVQSLNIPAIRLLHDYGMRPFVDFLSKQSGFSKIRQQHDDFGLSVILGACGVSLEELARCYTAFANGGTMHNLCYTVEEKSSHEQGSKLFSPEASWLIMDILAQNQRPDIPAYLVDQSELPRIAWKTGTSYGKKDAWAVGVNPRYTIGVWMGNFNGTGAPELSGAEMAVPLLFNLFNAIDNSNKKEWFAQPAHIGQRLICRESGMPAAEECSQTGYDFFIRKVSNQQPCSLYKSIYVDEKEKIQYCTSCLPATGYKKKNYPMYNAELALWYKENGKGFSIPPPHNPACEARAGSDGPQILSPSPAFEYYLDEDAPQQIAMQAASSPAVQEHYWYIDDVFYKKAHTAEKVFFMPKPGKHKISCMDDQGRTSNVFVKIKLL